MRLTTALASLSLATLWPTLACRGERMEAPPGPPSTGFTTSRQAEGGPGIQPGIHPHVVYGTLKNPYAGDAAAAAAGRRLFLAYNCYGCHGGRAGGGMGPSLRDSTKQYGSSDTQLFATIVEGRPAGMPAWGGRIPDAQIWQIITYIRTLGTPEEPDKIRVPEATASR
jgi:cytochrome c oxidase cbb3-type subunit 3